MPLKAVCYASSRHASAHGRLLAQGLERHGIKLQFESPGHLGVRADVHAVWGCHNKSLISMIHKRGEHVLIMERGYVGDRFVWTSMGWDGLNGRADFRNRNMPPERWNKHHGHLLQNDWQRNENGYALIMGQVTGDAAVKHVDIGRWYRQAARTIRSLGGVPAFRKHPKESSFSLSAPDIQPPAGKPSLEQHLRGARCAITYNSNSGVDAVLAGVPTVAVDQGSMVHSLVDHEISLNPATPDRRQWAYNIAYAQWLPAEISNGDAWDHIGGKNIPEKGSKVSEQEPVATIEQRRVIEHAKYARAYKDPNYKMGPRRERQTRADLQALPNRGALLDVGCGQGIMMAHARGLGFDPVRGTDIIPELLCADVEYAEVHALPFADKSFDTVTMFDVIEHLVRPDDELACKELLRCARKHILLSANNDTKVRPNGDQLHINIRPYRSWDALFRKWFAPHRVTWLKPPGVVRASEIWRVDIGEK